MTPDKAFFVNSKYPQHAEMLPFERSRLYARIRQHRPKIVLETGCGSGGGSTYYILKALQANENGGRLYTCDPDRGPSREMLDEFRDSLIYQPIKSSDLIAQLIQQKLIPDFIFFDGPDIPSIAIDDIKTLESHLAHGAVFSMHDWELNTRGYDKGRSIKASLIKPYLKTSPAWIMLEELSGMLKNSGFDEKPFDSVGLVFMQKL